MTTSAVGAVIFSGVPVYIYAFSAFSAFTTTCGQVDAHILLLLYIPATKRPEMMHIHSRASPDATAHRR
jgi:hypothetical protein